MAFQKSLEKWIEGILNEKIENRPLTAISIVHLQGGTVEKEIHSMKLTDGTDYNPKSLATTFQGRIETDSQNLIGVQQYVIYGFYGEKSQWQSRFPYTIEGEGGGKFNGLNTESPDARGMTQQGMRLTEAIVKGTFGTMANMQHFQHQFMSELATENRQLRQENRDAFNIIKEVMLEQTKLNHEQRMKEMEMQASLEMKRMLYKAAPVLVNQITGKEVFPQSTEDTALIEMLAEKIDPETLPAMLQMLGVPAAAQGALMARMTRYLQEKRETEERIRKVTGGNTSAELGFVNEPKAGEFVEDDKDAAQ